MYRWCVCNQGDQELRQSLVGLTRSLRLHNFFPCLRSVNQYILSSSLWTPSTTPSTTPSILQPSYHRHCLRTSPPLRHKFFRPTSHQKSRVSTTCLSTNRHPESAKYRKFLSPSWNKPGVAKTQILPLFKPSQRDHQSKVGVYVTQTVASVETSPGVFEVVAVSVWKNTRTQEELHKKLRDLPVYQLSSVTGTSVSRNNKIVTGKSIAFSANSAFDNESAALTFKTADHIDPGPY